MQNRLVLFFLVLFVSFLILLAEASNVRGEVFNPESCYGCFYQERCIPYGIRVLNASQGLFCSEQGKMQVQQQSESQCKYSYQCESNLCLQGKCQNVKKITDETSNFKILAVKGLCRMSNFGNSGAYASCLQNYGVAGPVSAQVNISIALSKLTFSRGEKITISAISLGLLKPVIRQVVEVSNNDDNVAGGINEAVSNVNQRFVQDSRGVRDRFVTSINQRVMQDSYGVRNEIAGDINGIDSVTTTISGDVSDFNSLPHGFIVTFTETPLFVPQAELNKHLESD